MVTSPLPNPNDLTSFVVSSAAGDFVFREGEAGADCFVIQDGQIELLKTHGGQPHRLALLGAGDFFGEDALFAGQPRDMSARAVTECRLLRIDRPTFDRIVTEDPAIALSMVQRLARYLRTQRGAAAPAAPADGQFPGRLAAEPLLGRTSPVASGAAAADAAPRQAVLTAAGAAAEFVLADREQWSVGRSDRASSRKPDIDLTSLDTERSLSRKHAVILRKDRGFVVREEPRVANGTFVDGKRIEPGREVELTDGVRVAFGLVKMVFKYR